MYASGGHPPALLIDEATGAATKLMTPNLAIGMMQGIPYKQAEVEIPRRTPGSISTATAPSRW